MSTVQDYASRLSDPGSRKMGTFSYLPPMGEAEIRRQVDWIVKNGWNPGIEHTEPEFAAFRSFAIVTECEGEPPYVIRFTGWYDDEAVRCEDGAWRFARRTIRLWDGEVLANFPGRGEYVPRKRPPSMVVKRPEN